MVFAMLCMRSNVAYFQDVQWLPQNLVCQEFLESFLQLTTVFHGGVHHEQDEENSAKEENRKGKKKSVEEKKTREEAALNSVEKKGS